MKTTKNSGLSYEENKFLKPHLTSTSQFTDTELVTKIGSSISLFLYNVYIYMFFVEYAKQKSNWEI